MSIVSIPDWTSEGVLPPIGDADPASFHRSPYKASLTGFIDRFCFTPQRCHICNGLLQYRAALHAAELTVGFQWVDGSFLERVEELELRSPNDVDVVTFFRLPQGRSPEDFVVSNPVLFDPGRVKADFHVDAYLVYLETRLESLVELSTYWYSLWSHRRNKTWKGYVEIDLAPANDAMALKMLASRQGTGGTP